MKKSVLVLILLLVVVIFVQICNYYMHRNSDDSSQFYSIEQFSDIIVFESTIDDVKKTAPITALCVTSYGGYTEYPCEGGKYIQIKFYGEDLIVYSIEVIDKTADNSLS